jgi:hypothetical protein
MQKSSLESQFTERRAAAGLRETKSRHAVKRDG